MLQLKASLSKSLKEVSDPTLLPVCWKGPKPFKSVDDLKKEFKPLVSLKFHHGVTMTIHPENYLIITVSTPSTSDCQQWTLNGNDLNLCFLVFVAERWGCMLWHSSTAKLGSLLNWRY